MTKKQHLAFVKLISYIAWTCIMAGTSFISYGVYKKYKENGNIYETKKLTTENYGKIVRGCYYVRGYCWHQYAFDLQKKLFKLGFSKNDSVIVINNCKKMEKLGRIKNVGQCIKTAGMIGYTESSGWEHCLNNNCMGLYSGRKSYKNKDKMFKDWIKRYVRYWYNHPKPYEYYGQRPITRYCYGGCINGLRNATKAYNILNNNK